MRATLIILSLLLIGDTLFASQISNPSLGVYLPALLGLPLLAVGVFYAPLRRFFARGFGRLVRLALVGGYALFFLGFVSVCCLLVGAAQTQPDPGAQAVVVLGAGLKDGKPSGTLARRLDRALEYLQQNPSCLVVVTGGVGQGQSVSEAQAMETYLLERGLEQERILKEESSTSTLENLQNAKAILETEAGLSPGQYRVVVVSTDFHIYRALKVAGRAGLDAQGLASRSSWYLAPNFYLREYVAVAGYWLLGRL